MIRVILIVAMFFSLHQCVTPDQRASMVNAAALKDLNCYNQDIIVTPVSEEKFIATCKRKKAFYTVKCKRFPKSCRTKRVR